MEKRRNCFYFPQYFLYISNFRSQISYSFVKCGCSKYYFLSSANLIYWGTDISKYSKCAGWSDPVLSANCIRALFGWWASYVFYFNHYKLIVNQNLQVTSISLRITIGLTQNCLTGLSWRSVQLKHFSMRSKNLPSNWCIHIDFGTIRL